MLFVMSESLPGSEPPTRPSLLRRRGQHGPRIETQQQLRGFARRLALDEEPFLKAAVSEWAEADPQRLGVERSRSRDGFAYVVYAHFLEHGLEPPEMGYVGEVPEELSSAPSSARRVRHSAPLLARWAYLRRHGGCSWEALSAAARLERETAQARAGAALNNDRRQLVRAEHAGDDVEAAFLSLRLGFWARASHADRDPERSEAYVITADMVRRAVGRLEHVWTLAERRFQEKRPPLNSAR